MNDPDLLMYNCQVTNLKSGTDFLYNSLKNNKTIFFKNKINYFLKKIIKNFILFEQK